jgi:hypothetical protein
MIAEAPVSPPLAGPLFSVDSGSELYFVDTSTLIYLDRIALLDAVCQNFAPATIAPVLAEFGRAVADLDVLPVATADAATDDALLAVACQHSGVLLSEDGGLLRRAGRSGLWYYNTLMLISGLCYHGVLGYREGEARIEKLLTFARYSDAVRAHGRKVFALVREHLDRTGAEKENP